MDRLSWQRHHQRTTSRSISSSLSEERGPWYIRALTGQTSDERREEQLALSERGLNGRLRRLLFTSVHLHAIGLTVSMSDSRSDRLTDIQIVIHTVPLSVCLSELCLSVYLSVYLYVPLSVSLFVCNVCLSICMSAILSVCLSVWTLSVYWTVWTTYSHCTCHPLCMYLYL